MKHKNETQGTLYKAQNDNRSSKPKKLFKLSVYILLFIISL